LLREQWTTETSHDGPDPEFAGRFASWLEHERARRSFWLALDAALALAVQRRLVRLILHPNPPSMAFWRSRGFGDSGDLWAMDLS